MMPFLEVIELWVKSPGGVENVKTKVILQRHLDRSPKGWHLSAARAQEAAECRRGSLGHP